MLTRYYRHLPYFTGVLLRRNNRGIYIVTTTTLRIGWISEGGRSWSNIIKETVQPIPIPRLFLTLRGYKAQI